MTVHELLTGMKAPLSNKEFREWMSFLKVKGQYEEEAMKKARK